VRLSYHWRSGACPGSSNVVWDGPRAALAADVSTGDSVNGLNITVTPPSSPGSYCLVYDLVREGITWFSWQGVGTLRADVSVTAAPAPYAVTWNSDATPSTMTAGTTTNVSVNMTNSGSLTWSPSGANPVRPSYHWRSGSCPGGSYVVWDGLRGTLPGSVATNQQANATIPVTAPSASGTYCLIYDLVREGVTWFSWQGASTRQVPVVVQAPVYGVTWSSHTTPANMSAGSTTQVSVSFANSGTLTWQSTGANPVRLSYHWRTGACPGSSTAVWDGTRALLPSDVAPGTTVTALTIGVIAPTTPGTYCLVYDLVREGVTWFSWQGASVKRVAVDIQ
jgi:hypothetical protein